MSLARQIQPILRVGFLKLPGLIARKFAKRTRLARAMRTLAQSDIRAQWRGIPASEHSNKLESDGAPILDRANAMLRDENIFFSFPYKLEGIERPWEFDPIEKKYWPRRHYTEQHLHASDTPRDAKIIWEINRFKDLPTLGQAVLITHDPKYADEAIRRVLSWIEGNPFASTINWASALEISIRLIDWTATIALITKPPRPVGRGGLGVRPPLDSTEIHPQIAHSIYQQAQYLAADLSTDKVVPTNHLIGEAAGLYIIASLWNFPDSRRLGRQAKRILTREMLRQTYPDGVTREASSWYHQFVTDLCDLADRVGAASRDDFNSSFRSRLADMKAFLEAMTVSGELVRYGDADDGWALWLEGDRDAWESEIFGPAPTMATKPIAFFHPTAQVMAAHIKDAFLFLRAGEFGMGGNGFSSHAHDDFLSPIISIAGLPILVDPGTFVYNGDPKNRAKYRGADAHNGIILGNETDAEQRMNFGWHRVRPDAKILEADLTTRDATVAAQYGEWPFHRRTVKIKSESAIISDLFDRSVGSPCEWYLHLAPEWRLVEEKASQYRFQNTRGHCLNIKLRGTFEKIDLATYDFSPSYGVAVPATMIRLSARNPSGLYAILLTIESAP